MPELSPMQREYRDNACRRWNIKTGATRSGKTWLDIAFIIPQRIMAVKGLPGLTVLLGNTKGTLQRNVIEPMQEIFGSKRVGSIRSDNTAEIFGERVHCLGADNKKHVDRLRGSSIKYCYGDEIVTWSKDVFDMLKSRLDKPYSMFDGTCNPEGPQHWFKDFLDSDADIFQQHYTIDDNPFLPKAFVDNLKAEYAGTVLFDRYILGKWAASEGALFTVYPKFTSDPAFLFNGIAHVDAAYGGSDGTAFTCGRRIGDTIYLYGRLWQAHVDTVMGAILTDMRRLRCSPIHLEVNADKGYLAREFQRMGELTSMYAEHQNKFFKIATSLRKWWPNIVFLEGTDRAYIEQIMAYTETADHDDAPDSAACICRLLDRGIITL